MSTPVNIIIEKLKELYRISLNRHYDIYILEYRLPELSIEDIIISIFTLREQRMVIGEEQYYHGGSIIKNFIITDKLINS